MKIRTLFLASAISLSLNIALAKNELDDPEVRAAIAVLEAKHDIEYNYQFCRAKAGDYGYKYDYIKYVWDLKNRPYIQVSEKIFDGLSNSSSSNIKQRWKRSSDKLQSARNSADNDRNSKYCLQYFSQMTNESTPNLSVFRASLAPRLGTHEEVRILERNIDMEVGCVKAGYNNDVKQFEGIKKACNCQTSLVVKRMSNREIDDYLAFATGKTPQDAVAFIEKKIAISELQACYSNIGVQ